MERGEKAWELDPKRNWRGPGFPQGDTHPVVCVTHNDAVAFCPWLTGSRRRTRDGRIACRPRRNGSTLAGPGLARCSRIARRAQGLASGPPGRRLVRLRLELSPGVPWRGHAGVPRRQPGLPRGRSPGMSGERSRGAEVGRVARRSRHPAEPEWSVRLSRLRASLRRLRIASSSTRSRSKRHCPRSTFPSFPATPPSRPISRPSSTAAMTPGRMHARSTTCKTGSRRRFLATRRRGAARFFQGE